MLLKRDLFSPEHEEFRRTARRFFTDEVMPKQAQWEEQGHVDRDIWRRAGELGLLCMGIPAEYGGAGADRLFGVVLMEEKAYTGATSTSFEVHSDIVASYIYHFGTEDQRRKWLPRMATGEVVGSLAMTEPRGGSDLQAIETRAILKEDGHYVLNGSKIFITNGYLGDLFVVAVKTGTSGVGKNDTSLLLVERDRSGFVRGKPLKKVGIRGQDTCELFFNDVRIPRENLLGGVEGKGFHQLMKELSWERLTLAVQATQAARKAFEQTLEYARGRRTFGKPIADYQNSQFKFAEMKTEISLSQSFVDRCVALALNDELPPDAAAAAKYWSTEMLCRVVDQCVQMHGGYGYMMEYPIARAFCDSRVTRIYLGANEIMREVIARRL